MNSIMLALMSMSIFSMVILLQFIGYIMITAPIAIPYLRTKLKKGVLLILKTDTGNYKLVSVKEDYHTKQYGTFIPNKDAIMRIAGIPVALGSTSMAVLPSPEACAAASKLEEAHAEVYTDINTTAVEAFKKGTLTKVDVDAIYRYSQNISPNFVEKRIAIRTAEILANNRDNLGKLFSYVILFIMVMVGGGIAIYMINAGSGSSISTAMQSVSIPV